MVRKVNASHILCEKQSQILIVEGKLNQGESFEELAKQHSICPSRKKGGNLGWFGHGQMVKEFEKACFAAKKGDIVGPVKTQFGYHLIKINDMK